MSSEKLCPKCGAPVSGEVAGGFCTACLLEQGFSPAEPPQNPVVLRNFGDYELLEEIARGGMGVVFKARQRSLNRIVAVKMILSGHLASEAETHRFRAEARAAAALQHPGIIAIHEVGEHEGLLYFSMDYVAGQSLAQLTRDGPWPATRAAQCVRDIAEAIHYAHEQGVLHRDLKPSNVLMDTNGKPHVTDFGLAKRLFNPELETQNTELTLSGQVLGSPNFMPPEQAVGKHHKLTPASDVYALGALLYHLVSGRPPFVAETLPQTLRMVTEQEPVSPRLLNAGVPRDLETICLKCLEKDQSRRYPSAQALADDLSRFLRNEPIQARPVSMVLKVHRWCVRNKPLAISGTAILALLLVVAIGSPIALFRIHHEREAAESARQTGDLFRKKVEDGMSIARAQVLCRENRYEEAHTEMSKVSSATIQAASQETAAILYALANWAGGQKRWQDADRHFAALMYGGTNGTGLEVESGQETMTCVEYAPVIIELGETNRYEKLRDTVLHRYRSNTNAGTAERMLMVSLLLPSEAARMSDVEGWASMAARTNPKDDTFAPWAYAVLTLLEYRRERFEQALEWGRKCLSYGEFPARGARAHVVMAMAYHGLDQPDQARAELEKCRGPIESGFDISGTGDYATSGFWHDRLINWILLREANTLIEGNSTEPSEK